MQKGVLAGRYCSQTIPELLVVITNLHVSDSDQLNENYSTNQKTYRK